MEDDELEDEDFGIGAYPWRWRILFVHALDGLGNFSRAVAMDLAASANYDIEQRQFRDAAAAEIETITTQEG